jgi:hypothetical protein
MIKIKKSGSDLKLNKTTVIIEDVELNSIGHSQPYNFTGTPILFITLENNAGVNFNNVFLADAGGKTLTHHSAVHDSCYSIAFSGDSNGDPLSLTILNDLSIVTINWTFPGLAVGSLTINIYTFAI